MLKRVNLKSVLIFFVVHAMLGIVMKQFRLLATFHAYSVLFYAVFLAMTQKNSEKVVYWSGYIVGCELLWRMCRAPYLLWEQGKYSLIVVLGLYTLRKGARKPLLPILYFLMLVPGILLVSSSDWEVFRREISFNLAGHLALMIGWLFFSKVQLSTEHLNRLLLIIVGPLVGVAAIGVHRTLGAQDLVFNIHSNAITSGGFGANQVSSAVGLGVFLCFFFAVQSKNSFLRYFIILTGLALAAQCAMTFSRGGLYNAVGGIVTASFFLIQDKKTRAKLIGSIIILSTLATFVIIPRLVKFTGGALEERFKSTNTTGRSDLIKDDIWMFRENMILGVGVGESSHHRSTFREAVAAHTEFTRLLAEHGLFGLAALLVLLWSAAAYFMRARSPVQKAMVVSFIAWSFLYMTNAAMRLALPSYFIALASVRLTPALFPPFIRRRPEVGNTLPIQKSFGDSASV